MKFIYDTKENTLWNINDMALQKCSTLQHPEIWAAVAYVWDDKALIDKCFKQNIKLTLWARADYSNPVRTDILQKFLNAKSANFLCKLIPDIFHPKVIWWKGYGIYIGSANLTHQAWNINFEAGMFFTEDEISTNNLRDDIDAFFRLIDSAAMPLTDELVKKIKEYENDSKINEEKGKFITKFKAVKDLFPPVGFEKTEKSKNAKQQLKKGAFLQEWNRTLQYLRSIGTRINAYKPCWVEDSIPVGVQVDQFLHAYYYNKVVSDRSQANIYLTYFENNKSNPDKALISALEWWKRLESPPSGEDVHMNEWAPFIRSTLSKNNIKNIGNDAVVEVLLKIHAFREYARRHEGFPNGLSVDDRTKMLASEMIKCQKSDNDIIKLWENVLYGGDENDVPLRLFDAWQNIDKHIEHIGIGTLGELVGWVLPDKYPPRNGRTSKALKAIGYEVDVL